MDRQIKVVLVVLIINFSLVPLFSSYSAYYIPRTHDLIIQENGLSTNSTWGASIYQYSGSSLVKVANITSQGGELVKSLPYGYYTYTVIVPQGYMSPESGYDFHLSVSSALQKQSVNFLKLYNAVFVEAGLTAPYNWSVTLNDRGTAVTHSSSTGNISFSVPTGEYSYRASYSMNTGSGLYYPQLSSVVNKQGYGTGELAPSNHEVVVNFTSRAYGVTFNVSTSQQLISENINGVGLTIDGRTTYFQYSFYNHTYLPVSLMLPNGTYQYATDNLTGYTISNGWGYITVNGTSVLRNISYRYGAS